eukprot:Gb_24283 [translate_table: standard]
MQAFPALREFLSDSEYPNITENEELKCTIRMQCSCGTNINIMDCAQRSSGVNIMKIWWLILITSSKASSRTAKRKPSELDEKEDTNLHNFQKQAKSMHLGSLCSLSLECMGLEALLLPCIWEVDEHELGQLPSRVKTFSMMMGFLVLLTSFLRLVMVSSKTKTSKKVVTLRLEKETLVQKSKTDRIWRTAGDIREATQEEREKSNHGSFTKALYLR